MQESPILIAALVVGVLLSAVGGGLAYYEVVSGVRLLVW
jgi:hypothetical protein